VDESGQVLSTQEGGPALFISQAFQAENVPHRSFENEKLVVEILVTKTGEFGKVPIRPKVAQPKPGELTDWTIISTVLDEWDLFSAENLPAHLFLDLQGYVRDGDDFGKKKYWKQIGKLGDKIFCIKSTREEMAYIPDGVLKDQKNRLLVITDGSKGTEIFSQGIRYRIPTKAIKKLKNTIGAGDTFLAYFVASLYKGLGVEQAGEYARDRTHAFLLKKLKNT